MFGKINDAYESVKKGLEAEIALATAEQKEKLADAKLALADIKSYLADLTEENRELRENLSKKENYKLDKGVYWKLEDEGYVQPFCPACYASDGKAVPMQPDKQNTQDTVFRCPSNKQHISNPFDYHSKSVVPRAGRANNWPRGNIY